MSLSKADTFLKPAHPEQTVMPKVTIAIPTRNRAEYLRLALESALAQTYQDVEIVVSDNRCTDGTAEYLATIVDPRVRVLRQAVYLSMVENWNACVAAATGTYFLLLSDDDVLEARAVKAMVEAFAAEPYTDRTGFVYCRGRMIDGKGKLLRPGMRCPVWEEAPQLIVAFFQGKREPWPCSVLLRRVDLGDGYSSKFLLITDAAAWIEAVCRYGGARFVDEELVNYRVHSSLTRATPVTVWQHENSTVAALAIDSLRQSGRSSATVERQIGEAVRTLNRQIVLSLPLDAPDRRRRTVLRTYYQHLPLFLGSGRDLFSLGRAVTVLAMPKALLHVARSIKRRLQR